MIINSIKLEMEIMRLQHSLDRMKARKMDSIESKPITNAFRDEINQTY